MYQKYFAWSFDDGLEQDKRIIEILKEFGMGATFHLNSGLYGRKAHISRMGNLGVTETPQEKFDPTARHPLPHTPHFRIPEDEVGQVYAGFEIASHTCSHINLDKCSEKERRAAILDDIRALSEKFNRPVVGFAYPYGGAKKSAEILRAAGIRYARTVKTETSFLFPKDPLQTPISSWHISPKTMNRLHRFFDMEPVQSDLFFLMFAHGYEFDFNTKESSWDKFRRICDAVAQQDNIVCCSIGEAFRLHQNK